MTSSIYEIVMLPDGEVVLQRASGDGEPLVKISFSEEVQNYLGASGMEVARAMIDAGIEAVEELATEEQVFESEEDLEERVLH